MPPKIPYKQVKINFKPEDFAKLEELAEAKGLSKSDWIRQKIGLNYEEARQPTATIVAKATDPKVLYELNKIGTNLNQIAEYANRNKVLDRTILKALVSIEDRLKVLL
jgi:hypothetical protein